MPAVNGLKKEPVPKSDVKTLLEHIFTAQVLLLARQLKADNKVQGKDGRVDYERKAVRIIKNAREGIVFRWNYELPGQD